ncbi:MAG: DUF4861 domain-containing protein [Prevotellaceae bacterium]|nr:DUF4861 domain-containing protein [Prevotellaceae bacterium]
MNKKISAFMLLSAMIATSAYAQKTFDVTVTNKFKTAKTNEPVVIELKDFGFDVKSALVKNNGQEIACQLDDLDQDGVFDELCFMTDVDKKSSKTFNVTLYDEGTPRVYDSKVYAELMLINRKVKISNQQDLYISQLTVEKGTNPYQAVHHHGVAFENELLAMRVYFDHRQTVDLYGKQHKGLELKATQFYPSKEQKEAGYGDDVLWVGTSFGLGALRGWDGNAQTMLNDVDYRTQRIISKGPVRAIVEIEDKGWTPQPGQKKITMKTFYTIYAGKRECSVDVKFNKNASDYLFATGLVNVKNSTEYSDKKGVRGCWGADWTVAPKDTAGRKKETVGLGIYVPIEYIVSEEKANKDDYAYVVKTNGDELHYKITYCSDNEDFGYHNEKDWFAFLEDWKKDIQQPLEVKIVK